MSQTSGESNDSQNAFDILINTQKEDINKKDFIKKLIANKSDLKIRAKVKSGKHLTK